jgi:hypothetical protein
MNKQQTHNTDYTDGQAKQTHNTNYTDEQKKQTQNKNHTDKQKKQTFVLLVHLCSLCYVFVDCSSV